MGSRQNSAKDDSSSREETHPFALLFEKMPQGVVFQDAQGAITMANPAAERLLGLSLDQMQGRTSTDPRWRAIHPDGSDFPGEQHPASEALRTGTPVRNAVMGVFHPEKQRYVWLLIDAEPDFRPGESRPCRVFTTFTDITREVEAQRDLMTAKEEAEEESRQFKTAADQANYGMAFANFDGVLFYTNREFARMHGYEPEELLGKNLSILHSPEQMGAVERSIALLKREGSFNALEIWRTRKDGSPFPSLMNAQIIADAAGRPQYMYASTIDISEPKQLEKQEEERAERESRQHAALETLIRDETLITSEFSAALDRITKLAAEALIVDEVSVWKLSRRGDDFRSLSIYDRSRNTHLQERVVPPEATANYLKEIKGHGSFIIRASRVDGTPPEQGDRYRLPPGIIATFDIPILLAGELRGVFRLAEQASPRLWQPDEQTFAASVASMVGQIFAGRERAEALELLRAGEERYRRIVETAHEGIWLLDAEDKTNYANRRLLEMLGYTAADLQDRSLLEFVIEEDRPLAREFLNHRHRGEAEQHELQLRRKNGETILTLVNSNPIYGDSGEFTGTLKMVADITDRRRAERERIARESAEASNDAKSAFLANMSHELRTPMNAILGYAHLIQQEPLSPRQQSQLDKLSGSTKLLLGVINDVLDLSKIDANEMRLEARPFEPSRIVQQVCDLVMEKVKKKKLELKVDLRGLPAVVEGDGFRLNQILLNITSNAVKFTDAGSITIRGHRLPEEEGTVRLRFEISDTGIGMSPEQIKKVFVPFDQGDVSITRRYGGTGLGLTICKRLTEIMGGTISAESVEGEGSTFSVEIPFGATGRSAQRQLPWESIRGRRALVVDDDLDAAEISTAMLSELGLPTSYVASGSAAVEELLAADRAADPFSFVFIDWSMPKKNGIDTAREITALELSERPTLLMLTAYPDSITKEAAESAGIVMVLTKPVTPSALHDALTEIAPAAANVKPSSCDQRLREQIAQFPRIRVLLVEDNPINQDVAKELLQIVGAETVVAENGEVAVELAKQSFYGLVLMDVQMPVLDGLEATRRIRALPGWGSIPIVAMTANAFTENVEACLAAGMDDHIPKPVEPRTLYCRLLRRLFPGEASASAAEEPSPVEPPIGAADVGVSPRAEAPSTPKSGGIAAEVPQIPGLDVATGLRYLAGNSGSYNRLLRRFPKQHGEDAATLRRLAEQKELDHLRQHAHALKGVAGTLGMTRISELAKELEEAARERDEETITALIPRLSEELQETTAALETAFGGEKRWKAGGGEISPTARPQAGGGPVGVGGGELGAGARRRTDGELGAGAREILGQLSLLLAESDAGATAFFEKHRTLLESGLGTEAETVAELIEEFDFEAALTILRKATEHSGL